MANKKANEWRSIMGKRLIVLGVALFLTGVLRFYNFDWPVVLMVVGVFLVLKGFVVKYLEK